MSYKKYIKRNGKLYGPYEYESKRIDGKVVTEYHGAKKTNSFRNFIFIFAALLIVAALVWVIGNIIKNNSSNFSGQSVLELNANYKPGEILNGKLDISLNNGELLPADSKIIIENSDKAYEFPLREVVSEQPNEGDFYINGKDISGSGEGYGKEGNAEVYPQVYFKLNVYTEEKENNNEEVIENVEETTNETTPEVTPELNTETPIETTLNEETSAPAEETGGATITGDSIGKFVSGGSITGRVSLNLEKQIDGVVTGDKEYVYELNSGESVELEPLSVKTSTDNLDDNKISIKTEGNQVIITTDYSEKQKGFGKNFMEDNSYKISVDLNKLNLSLEKGNIDVKVVYNQKEILSLNAVLDEDVIVNESTPVIPNEENNLNESLNTSGENLNETINETINQTQENLSETNDVGNLTIQEKAALLSAFGNTQVSVVKSELFKGRTIIGYKLGNYEIEYSYDSSLSQDSLQREMEKDRIKWLKDIAKSLVERESHGENISGINASYGF